MDIISIKQLKVLTTIGIYEWEKNKKQELFLDIDLKLNITKAAKYDNILYSVDYTTICSIIKKYIETNTFKLIERIAEETANIILRHNTNIFSVYIKVYKPSAITEAKNVSVIIERNK